MFLPWGAGHFTTVYPRAHCFPIKAILEPMALLASFCYGFCQGQGCGAGLCHSKLPLGWLTRDFFLSNCVQSIAYFLTGLYVLFFHSINWENYYLAQCSSSVQTGKVHQLPNNYFPQYWQKKEKSFSHHVRFSTFTILPIAFFREIARFWFWNFSNTKK